MATLKSGERLRNAQLWDSISGQRDGPVWDRGHCSLSYSNRDCRGLVAITESDI